MINDIFSAIETRQSARVPFDPERPVSKDDLRRVLEAARWAPTAHNMQNFEIVIVDDRKTLKALAGIHYPVSLTFVRENYQQMSFSKDELRSKKVGVLGEMFPESWRKPDVSEKDLNQAEGRPFLSQQIGSAPVVGIVVYDPSRRAPASENDFLGAVSLGCVMENMWLAATSLGLGFHIVSSLSGDPAAKEVKSMLGIPAGLKIAYSFRLGYPVESVEYLRVRRDIEDFTHRNHYGTKGA
jgi:nitroreductase